MANLTAIAEAQSRDVDEFEAGFAANNPDAIVRYFSMVLDRSVYPEGFPKTYRMAFAPESKQLVVELWALVEAAQKTRTGDGPLREQYKRIAKRRGAKVARVAIARQILTLSYYGLRDGEIRRFKTPAPASPMKVSATA